MPPAVRWILGTHRAGWAVSYGHPVAGCFGPIKVVCIRVTQRLESDPNKTGEGNKGYGWLLVPRDPEPCYPLRPGRDWKECKPL